MDSDRCAQDLDIVFLQDAHLSQLAGDVQAGLAADAGDDSIRPLLLDDLGHDLRHQRLDVDLVRHIGIGHDGSRIGVDQDYLYSLLAKGFAGLGTGEIELCRLADLDGARAYEQDLVDIGSLGHLLSPPCCVILLFHDL